jgi:hypothetical protein
MSYSDYNFGEDNDDEDDILPNVRSIDTQGEADYFSGTKSTDYYEEQIANNRNLFSFFNFQRKKTDIDESEIKLEDSDSQAFIFKDTKTLYDTKLHINKKNDVRGIHKKYYLPLFQPSIDSWIKRQEEYLSKLNLRQQTALSAYSYHGDKLINGYLRGNLMENCEGLMLAIVASGDVPFKYAIHEKWDWLTKQGVASYYPKEDFMKQGKLDDTIMTNIVRTNIHWFSVRSNIEPLILSLLQDLTHLIYETPRVSEDMIVYRGVRTDREYVLEFESNDYWSSTLNPYAALSFTSPIGRDCYHSVYEIRITPKIPCIFLQKYSKFHSSEYEVLLPPGIEYEMNKKVLIKEHLQKKLLNGDVSVEEYITLAKSNNPRRRILTIGAVAKRYDEKIPSLKAIHDKWNAIQNRKKELNRRFMLRHDKHPLSRQQGELFLKSGLQRKVNRRSKFTRKNTKTRRSSSRKRNISRRQKRNLFSRSQEEDAENEVEPNFVLV